MTFDIICYALLFIFIALAIFVRLFLLKHWKKKEDQIPVLIQKELKERRGTLKSIEKPNLFDTGPFPKIEVEWGVPVIRVAGFPIATRKTFYRKIIWQDFENNEHLSWAKFKIYFTDKNPDVDWEPEKATNG